eukprot:6198391-Pleurochrysis_carterae.AAC.1
MKKTGSQHNTDRRRSGRKVGRSVGHAPSKKPKSTKSTMKVYCIANVMEQRTSHRFAFATITSNKTLGATYFTGRKEDATGDRKGRAPQPHSRNELRRRFSRDFFGIEQPSAPFNGLT